MYKVKVNDRMFLVKAKNKDEALHKVGRKLADDNVSPMTYKLLREKGYTPEDWKNWSKQEKEEKSRSNATAPAKTATKPISEPTAQNKAAVKGTPVKRELAVKGADAEELYKKIQNGTATEDDIRKNPAIRKAKQDLEAKLGTFNPETGIASNETININTPERQKLRQDIADKMLNRGSLRIVRDENGRKRELHDQPVDKNFRAEIVIGRPAGGKSSTIVNKVSQNTRSRIVDSDEVKKELPEFDGGNGAGIVHKESADEILEKLIIPQYAKGGAHQGDNIVIPIVGKKPKSALKYLKMLKDAGYEVHLSFNEVSGLSSMKRAANRFLEEGRFLDPDYIASISDGPEKTYEAMKNLEGDIQFDSFSKYDNDVPFGQPAKKIEKVDRKGNKLAWEDWQ